MRRLAPSELAQIAGRAGRHTTDGTFGVTEDCRPLEQEVIDAIESVISRRAPILARTQSELQYAKRAF